MSSALFTEISRTLSLTGVVSAAVAAIAIRSLEDRLKSVTAEEWKASSNISVDTWPAPEGKVPELVADAVHVLNNAHRVTKGSDADTIIEAASKVVQTRLDAIAEHLLTMPTLVAGLDVAAEGSHSVETTVNADGTIASQQFETSGAPASSSGEAAPSEPVDTNAQPAAVQ
jgi:hypothetical protein